MGVTLAGTEVSAWADQSGNARDAAQGVVLEQPTYNAAGAPGGMPSVDFVTTNDNMDLGGPAFPAVTSWSIVAGLDILAVPNPFGQGGGIVDGDTGTGFITFCTDVNVAQHGMLTGGAWQTTGAAPVIGAQTVVHAVDAAGPTGVVYRNGAAIGAPHPYVPRQMPGVTIGVDPFLPWLVPMNARLWKLAIFSRVLTAPEIALCHTWAATP